MSDKKAALAIGGILTAVVIGIAVASSGKAKAQWSIYDLNNDGVVDDKDLDIFIKAYLSQPGDPNWNPACDFNHDNIIDTLDFSLFSEHYGETKPPEQPPPAAEDLVVNSVSFNGTGVWVNYTINNPLPSQLVISAVEWVPSTGSYVTVRGYLYQPGSIGHYNVFISTPNAGNIDIVQLEWGDFNIAHPTLYWYLPYNRLVTGDEYTKILQERFGY
jgi:hypothetical protein